MTISDVQLRSDGGYYATVDGKELEFSGDGQDDAQDDTRATCDQCGQIRPWLYSDNDGRVIICRDCLDNWRTNAIAQ